MPTAVKAKVPSNVTFLTVPAGTRPTHCRGQSCNALIYFVVNPKTGRPTPVDCDVEGGKRPSESKELGQLDMLTGGEAEVYDGRGCSHFLTCSDADQFSGGAR
jgi:hypothetical protein